MREILTETDRQRERERERERERRRTGEDQIEEAPSSLLDGEPDLDIWGQKCEQIPCIISVALSLSVPLGDLVTSSSVSTFQ